jgi:hypothetical protein
MQLETLKSLNTFVCWKYTSTKSGKPTKPPFGAKDGKQVGVSENYRSRWGTYSEAVSNCKANKLDGIGIVFTEFNDTLYICGIDVDKNNPDSEFVKNIIALFPNAYIEHSPSGNGVHIILLVDVSRIPQGEKGGKAALAPQYYCKNPNNGVEAYVATLTNRYFTFTENTIQDGSDVDQTDEFLQFLEPYMLRETKPKKEKTPTVANSAPTTGKSILSDEKIIEKASKAVNGAKFIGLYDFGDSYEDDSAADIALMNILAFWCRCDSAQMERLFSQSTLGERDKWQNRADYRQMTIDRAIADCKQMYEPKPQASYSPKNANPTVWALPIVDSEVMSQLCAGDSRHRKFSIAAARMFLQAFGVKVRTNDMNRRAEIHGLPDCYSGEDACNLLEILIADAANGLAYKRASMQVIHDCLAVIASENRYHPVIELLNSEPWDGADRLPDIFGMINLTDDFHKTLFRKWALQTIAVLYNTDSNPISAEGVLVLQGEQGLGKTQFFRHLAIHKQFFKGGASLDTTNKDSLMSATKVWLCELGEIDTTTKREQSALKAFLTEQTDRYREPYARCETIRPRRTSFCGTVNPRGFLRDETGNRRYWTIPVDKIDIDRVFALTPEWYAQFWRQIHEEYHSNPKCYLLTKDEENRVNRSNQVFEVDVFGEDEFMTTFNTSGLKTAWKWLTASQIAGILNKKNSGLNIRSESVGRRLLPRIERRIGERFERKTLKGCRLILCPPESIDWISEAANKGEGDAEDDDYPY